MTTYILDSELITNEFMRDTASQSNDTKRQVACHLILANGRLYKGYNHTAYDVPEKMWTEQRPLMRLIVKHAEISAIEAAIEGGVANLSGATMYVTLEPCGRCREVIELAGIETVYFGELYIPTTNL